MKNRFYLIITFTLWMMGLLITSSFKFYEPSNTSESSKVLTYKKGGTVTFHEIASSGAYPLYTGIVHASGAINGTGIVTMIVEAKGNVLHCTTTYDFADGSITIMEYCNLSTFNGQWKVIDGTGDYEGYKGNGSFIMQDEEMFLTGNIYP